MDADNDNEDHCTDKLGEHSKCCHGNSAFATSQNDIVSEFFKIGETLFLTNDGWSGLVKVKKFLIQSKHRGNFCNKFQWRKYCHHQGTSSSTIQS